MSYGAVMSFTGNEASTLSVELSNSTAEPIIVELRDPSAAAEALQLMKRFVLEANETAKVLNFSSRGLHWVPSKSFFTARRMMFKARSLKFFFEIDRGLLLWYKVHKFSHHLLLELYSQYCWHGRKRAA